MPKIKNKIINLIPENEFESGTFGRVLKWALSSFRIMVIITELVVMTAFMSRFWLDAKNSDLNEELEIGRAQIEAYQDVESEFRLIQKKLSIAKSLYNEPETIDLLNIIATRIPSDVFLNSIILNHSTITIKASSLSENSISQFITNLEENKKFTDISLSQLSTDQESTDIILFNINGKVK